MVRLPPEVLREKEPGESPTRGGGVRGRARSVFCQSRCCKRESRLSLLVEEVVREGEPGESPAISEGTIGPRGGYH